MMPSNCYHQLLLLLLFLGQMSVALAAENTGAPTALTADTNFEVLCGEMVAASVECEMLKVLTRQQLALSQQQQSLVTVVDSINALHSLLDRRLDDINYLMPAPWDWRRDLPDPLPVVVEEGAGYRCAAIEENGYTHHTTKNYAECEIIKALQRIVKKGHGNMELHPEAPWWTNVFLVVLILTGWYHIMCVTSSRAYHQPNGP